MIKRASFFIWSDEEERVFSFWYSAGTIPAVLSFTGNPFPVFTAVPLQSYPFLKEPAPDVAFVRIIFSIPAICAGFVFHTNHSLNSLARPFIGTKIF